MIESIAFLILGTILLYYGAEWVVKGGVHIAETFQISPIVIGLTVVAFGTSLPEFATSFVAAFRKQSAISIGNIVGSNLFNILSVLGFTAMVKPLITPEEILSLEIPFMIVFGIVLFPMAWMKQPLPRWVSALIFCGYLAFIIMLFAR